MLDVCRARGCAQYTHQKVSPPLLCGFNRCLQKQPRGCCKLARGCCKLARASCHSSRQPPAASLRGASRRTAAALLGGACCHASSPGAGAPCSAPASHARQPTQAASTCRLQPAATICQPCWGTLVVAWQAQPGARRCSMALNRAGLCQQHGAPRQAAAALAGHQPSRTACSQPACLLAGRQAGRSPALARRTAPLQAAPGSPSRQLLRARPASRSVPLRTAAMAAAATTVALRQRSRSVQAAAWPKPLRGRGQARLTCPGMPQPPPLAPSYQLACPPTNFQTTPSKCSLCITPKCKAECHCALRWRSPCNLPAKESRLYQPAPPSPPLTCELPWVAAPVLRRPGALAARQPAVAPCILCQCLLHKSTAAAAGVAQAAAA